GMRRGLGRGRATCIIALLAAVAVPVPGWAQHAGHAEHAEQTEQTNGGSQPEHPGHAGHSGSADAAGSVPPPPVPADHAADRIFPAERMARARGALRHEGRIVTGAVEVERFEYRAGAQDGYHWDASAWYGGDIDRIVLSSEGEGAFGGRAERAETRLGVRHALGPWWNLHAGVRHDFGAAPQRTYAAMGIEGLAPYWIEVKGEMFVSDRGDFHLRFEASHDFRISGPVVLEAAAETDVALQDVPAQKIGGGIEQVELGARLRYELRPDFAPYVGIHWERKLGRTARYARAEEERASAVSALIGLRAWF
ncbi:MAG: copper resistance protein B, partial [Pseudomonadota bacterium]